MSSKYDRINFNYSHAEKVLAAKLRMRNEGIIIKTRVAIGIEKTVKPEEKVAIGIQSTIQPK